MSKPASKRFWTDVAIHPAGNGFEVRLDDRPVKIPDHGPLLLPNRALADAVAEEWRQAGEGRQGGAYAPDDIGMTRLAGTMLVRAAKERDTIEAGLLGFLDSDVLCYRAEFPVPLVALQAEEWQPWLDWSAERLGARLDTTTGILPIEQPEAARHAIAAIVAGQDAASLTALGVLVPVLGSIVLGLACVFGALTADEAFDLSTLDDRFQARQWGDDAEAAERREGLRADCIEAMRFAHLARMDRSVRITVEGRVQGVGYRAWLASEARRLELSGWVRNLPDGRVEAVLRGPAGPRDALVALAKVGPRMADVRAVVVAETDLSADDEFVTDFEIRR